jgi:hypothetical protein
MCMKAISSGLLVLSSFCTLSACSPSAGPPGPITAAELPKTKPGLWEVTQSNDGGPPATSRSCSTGSLTLPGAFILDACAPGVRPPASVATPSDSANDIHFNYVTSVPGSLRRTDSGAIAIDIACSQKGASTNLKTTVSGDFQSSYVIDSKTTMGMGDVAAASHATHQVYKYIGPCRPT